jgi:NAD(P)-dependent dehydrogenase (short-subunit alcohol dehydrogenase family)
MQNVQNVFDLFRLDGKTALVTGGSKGLGRVMATTLAQAGASVVITSRTESEVVSVAKEIALETGQDVQGFVAEVTNAQSLADLAAQIGPVDILINNAGINKRGNIAELSEDDFDTVVATNLKGPFLVCKQFGPGMAERGWGRIINMGSALSAIALPGRTPYASTKAAMVNFTKVLALEWATNGVTVNTLCPGPFATEMNLPLLENPEAYAQMIARIPLGRWAELHEIQGAALFLASPASSYVTGSCIFVDGGWTAH